MMSTNKGENKMSDFMNEWSENDEKESGEFSVIPEGKYMVAVDNCTIDMTKSPNRLSVVYKIVGPSQGGRKLFGNYNLAGQGVGFLKKDLKILGLDYSSVKKPEDLVELVWTAVNNRVNVTVKHREFGGRTYESVFLNDIMATPKKPASPRATNKKPPKEANDDSDFSFA